MAHYAYLDENNIVTAVIVGKDENELVDGITDWEQYYGAKRTSYNTYGNTHLNGGTPYRYNYAGIGYTFDPTKGTNGAFIPPKPYDSWVLNENTCIWEAPIPRPDNNKYYVWFEPNKQWIEVITND